MAYNNKNNTGRGISKETTAEKQDELRRAAKAKQKPGGKNGGKTGDKKSQTAPTLLKEFDPTKFEVRNKAAALLETPNKEAVVAAFGKFFTQNSADAYNLLWKLTFQSEDKKSQLLKEKLGLAPDMVSDLPLLLKELAAQYRAYVDPDFMLAPNNMRPDVKHAFDALYPESHAAALFMYEMCADYVCAFSMEHITHNLDRLGSDAENRIHGGVLDLIKVVDMPARDDRYALSAYLKPRYKKIHDLLKAMADAKAAEEKAIAANPNSVLANLDTLCKNAGLTLEGAPELPAYKQELPGAHLQPATEEDNSPKDFNYANVAANPELFSSMAKATAKLKELGIDPTPILKNLDTVREFLKQVTQLEDAGFSPSQYPDKEDAIAQVLKAEAARKDAEQLFT